MHAGEGHAEGDASRNGISASQTAENEAAQRPPVLMAAELLRLSNHNER